MKQFFSRVILLTSFIFLSILTSGQNSPFEGIEKGIIPASPNAAALAQYGEIPVSHFTGVPSISVPLFSIGTKNVTVPISLSYHSGGIKVNQEASNVGLGWVLNAGGAIVRNIRGGVADDAPHGFFLNNATMSTKLTQYTFLLNASQDQVFDTEADLYTYNFVNMSGKLIPDVDINGNVDFIPTKQNDHKFEKIGANWVITDENGNIYYFEDREDIVTSSQTSIASSSWYVTRIVDAQTKEVINFEYVDSYKFGEVVLSETQNTTHFASQASCPTFPIQYNINDRLQYKVKTLSRIYTNQFEILFINSNSNGNKEYIFKTISGEIIKKFELKSHMETVSGYSPGDNIGNRLILDEVVEKDAVNNQLPSWEFEYTNLSNLPEKNSKSIDHWGYYNGVSNSILIPAMSTSEFPPSGLSGADRSPDELKMKYGTINKIKYPTGGYTEFDFEPHQYKKEVPQFSTQHINLSENYIFPGGTDGVSYQSFTIDRPTEVSISCFIRNLRARAETSAGFVSLVRTTPSPPLNPIIFHKNIGLSTNGQAESKTLLLTSNTYPATFKVTALTDYPGDEVRIDVSYGAFSHIDTITKIAGGLRIKEIKTYDKVGGTPLIKTFVYKDANNLEGGEHLGDPLYHYGTEEYNASSTLGCHPRLNRTSNSMKRTINGVPVVYPFVEEITPGNGKIINEFSFKLPSLSNPHYPTLHNFTIINTLPNFTPYNSEDYLQGNLLSRSVFDENGVLKQKNTVNYENILLNHCENYVVKPFVLPASRMDNVSNYDRRNNFYIIPYKDLVGWSRKISETTKIYDNNGQNPIESTTNYFYDPAMAHTGVVRKETTNSDGTVYTEKYKYPADYAITTGGSNEMASAIFEMKQKNMISTPIESSSWYDDGTGNKLIGASLSTFKGVSVNGLSTIQPAAIYKTEMATPIAESSYTESNITANSFVFDSHFEPVLYFNSYDNNYKLTEVEQVNGLKHSYQWSDDGTRLYAQRINSDAEESDYNGFEDAVYNTTNDPYTGDWAVYSNSNDIYDIAVITTNQLAEQYKLSLWIKTPATNTASPNINVRAFKTDGSVETMILNSVVQQAAIATDGEWRLQEFEFNLADYPTIATQIQTGEKLVLKAFITSCSASSAITLDDVRLHPQNSLMNSYAYDERFGVSEIVDANNRKATYEYDGFGRMQRAFNDQGELLQEVEYHYQTAGEENYVKTYSPRMAMTALPTSFTPHQVSEGINYFDGLGRGVQQIAIGATPDQRDVIVPMEYDALGRQVKEYLPYTDNVDGGAFRTNWQTAQADFYTTGERVAHTTVPYSEKLFDNSPQNRIIEQASPGSDWQMGNGHTVEQFYRSNEAHEVLNFQVDATGNAVATTTYDLNELSVTIKVDEEKMAYLTYTDKNGRQLLTKTKLTKIQAESVGGGNSSGNAAADLTDPHYSTYYVYNLQGQLTHVIPPLAIEQMDANNSFNANNLSDDLVYEYKYDEEGRVYEKKIPGAGSTTYVYDNLDRPILTQTAKQATEGEWSFVKYDQLGRQIQSGLQTSSNTRAQQQTAVDAHYLANNNYEERSATNTAQYHGYSNQAFPTTNASILTVDYYDDYDFNNDGTADAVYTNTSLDPIQNYAPGQVPTGGSTTLSNSPNNRIKGLATGGKVKILNGNMATQWIETTNFYDEKGRLIQSQANNHLGGTEQMDLFYDFTGQIIHSQRIHSDGVETNLTLINRYEYDHTGKLKENFQQINEQDPILLAEQHYNPIGQMIEKNVHSSNWGNSFLQSMDYAYNIRGWLTHINNADLSNDEVVLEHFEDEVFQELTIENITIQVDENINAEGETEMEMTVEGESEATYEEEGTGEESTEEYGESESEVLMEEADPNNSEEVAQYNQLLLIEGEEITLDFNSLVIPEGSSTAAVLTMAETLLTNELTTEGITDQGVIGEVWAQVNSYIQQQYGSTFFNDDDDDIWGTELKYNEAMPTVFTGTPMYNGNITQAHWQSKKDGVKKAYSYEYDVTNRITAAHYRAYDQSTGWTQDVNYYSVPNISYDANGNITSLQRWGQLQNQSFGLMDDLSYAHNGNQVQQVNDAIINGGVKDFAEAGTNLTVEYLYDASGNMIEDKNKGILINYNHLNLPTVINFNNGNSIRYVYLADGTKIQKLAENTATNTTTVSDYVASIHYEGGTLQFFQHEEGRTVFNGEMYTNEYNYKDHLGNTRLSFSDLNFDGDINLSTEVLQTTDYYPFGMEHTNNSHVQIGPKSQYLYNGKEMQSDFGLDWYDYGARFYNPSIGLWGQVDPLAEKYYSSSPYNYVMNNPLIFIDPDGREWVNVHTRNLVGMNERLKRKQDNGKKTGSLERKIEREKKNEAKVDKMINDLRENDEALFNYIDKLTIVNQQGKEINVKVNVSLSSSFKGRNGQPAQTSYLNRDNNDKRHIVAYKRKENLAPFSPSSGLTEVGFDVKIYRISGSQGDVSLANEIGDIMFRMEYPKLTIGTPSGASYFNQGGDTRANSIEYNNSPKARYSNRVQNLYRHRKNDGPGNDIIVNPYPLKNY